MLADVGFRTASAEDVLSISVAAIHVFLDTYATDGLPPVLAREAMSVYSVAAFRPRLSDAATTFVLAERGEQLLGFAEVTRGRPCPSTVIATATFNVELVRLYLLPVAQGQGLGTSLLRHVEGLLAAGGATGLWLSAWSGNQRALAFYPAVGYECVGKMDHVIEDVAYENQVFAKSLRDGRLDLGSGGSSS